MSDYGPPDHSFGQAGVMWVLANHDEPMTIEELSEQTPIEKTSASNILLRLFRKEFVVRRRREHAKFGHGSPPYEYAIRERQEGTDDRE